MKKTLQTIDEALDYLYSFINYETDSSYAYGAVHYNVDRTVRLLECVGSPERDMEIIHVAGTKGKGSVCAVLDAVLRATGSITGVFTSPHIRRVNERIRVNGKPIRDTALIELLNELGPHIDAFPADLVPTTFEILTVVAVLYFKRENVRYCILETGMGGRFDSTNFCDPIVSVITSISYDHMDKLGNTIEQIASEKAGIIKQGRPAVLGYQAYDVEDVFSEAAARAKSPLYTVWTMCSYSIIKKNGEGTTFRAEVDGLVLPALFIPLAGKHQVENTLTALCSLRVAGILPELDTVSRALKSVCIPARLERIRWKGRTFLLDSAHNADSARVLVEAVRTCYTFERLAVIVGIVRGKDIDGILSHLTSVADLLVVTEPVTHKELDTQAVYKKACTFTPPTVLVPEIGEAMKYAIDHASGKDIILVTGSFYTVSPARAVMCQENESGEVPG